MLFIFKVMVLNLSFKYHFYFSRMKGNSVISSAYQKSFFHLIYIVIDVLKPWFGLVVTLTRSHKLILHGVPDQIKDSVNFIVFLIQPVQSSKFGVSSDASIKRTFYVATNG